MRQGWMSRIRAGVAVLTAMGALVWSSAWADVGYVYDELGRLVQSVAPDGSSVQYSYDAAGNITAIRRTAAGALSVAEFTPNTGPAGTVVTLYGTGFSATPGNNTVRFNGTAATVNTASATSLTVVVPAGASTGRIAVSNANGSVTSATDYVVGATAAAPTVTSFTPTIGTAGTEITVTGTNFQSNAEDNKAAIGSLATPVTKDATTPTATSLKLRVPAVGASGKIAVTTPHGKVVSTDDFISLPSDVNSADVQFKGRLVVDGAPLTVTTTTAGKKAALVFDAPSGASLHFLSSGGTFASSVAAGVFRHDGTRLESLTVTNNGVADFLQETAVAGTYTVILTPGTTDRGTLQLGVVSDVTGTLTVDGSTPVSLTPGRNARYSFAAEAGKGYALALASLALAPSGNMNATLRRADGTSLGACSSVNGLTCDFAPDVFATTGTYYLEFDPQRASAATFNAVLSKDIVGAIAVDGATTTVPIAREGQNARYTFSGTAGQRIHLVLSANALDDGVPGVRNPSVSLYRAGSATRVASNNNLGNNPLSVTDVILPETDTYTVVVNPAGLDKGTIGLDVKSAVTGPLTVDGSTAISIGAGRTAYMSFTAEAGKGYGLGITNLAVVPDANMAIILRKADGTSLGTCNTTYVLSCDFPPDKFETAGAYFFEFNPGDLSSASFNTVLSKDTGGSITVDAATTTTVNIAREGQNARYTFNGTAGQMIHLVLSANTLDDGVPGISLPSVFLQRTGVAGNVASNVGGGVATATTEVTLPETGSYTVIVNPSGLNKGTLGLDVKTTLVGTLSVDGSTPIQLSPGRNARMSFSAEAGKGYGLGLASLVVTPTANVAVTLRRADGTSLSTCSSTQSLGCDFAPDKFAAAGTYLLDFDPPGLSSATLNAVLSSDAAGTLTVGAAAATVTIAREGQNARYTFGGTAGQLLRLTLSANTLDDGVPPVVNPWVYVFRPGAATHFASNASGGSPAATVDLTLPEAGTYTVLVNPPGLDKGTVGLRLTTR